MNISWEHIHGEIEILPEWADLRDAANDAFF